jgi:predicted RNase H-like nuclease
MVVVGVDGCPGGWLAMSYEPPSRTLTPRLHRSFALILAAYPDAAAIAVDIPIGLATGEPRQVDGEARRRLGGRASSVFPAPDSRFMDATTDEMAYGQALTTARAITGTGISKQNWAIGWRIRQVNRLMTPERQRRVVEIHPEVCFWALAGGRPMVHPKRTPAGYAERQALLAEALGMSLPARGQAGRWAPPATADDVLDAIAAAWAARRLAEGSAGRLPDDPPLDGRGRRMEMVY